MTDRRTQCFDWFSKNRFRGTFRIEVWDCKVFRSRRPLSKKLFGLRWWASLQPRTSQSQNFRFVFCFRLLVLHAGMKNLVLYGKDTYGLGQGYVRRGVPSSPRRRHGRTPRPGSHVCPCGLALRRQRLKDWLIPAVSFQSGRSWIRMPISHALIRESGIWCYFLQICKSW